MKRLSGLEGFVTLNRTQQSTIFGGCGPTVECDGNGDPSSGGGGKKKFCETCSGHSECGSELCGISETHCGDRIRRCL